MTGSEAKMVDLLLVGIGGTKVFVAASEIKQVLRAKPLTAVPMGPQHLKGLANVHGQVVCVIDAGGVTSLPYCAKQANQNTRLLLLRHAEMHVAIWVDAVYKMQQLDASVFADALAKGDEKNDSSQSIVVEGISYDFLQCSKLLHLAA
ncbi:MAG: chemotaxis protein CheW [Mariprofundus sp.]|nr:chemotaxis protein CheW [Mariprofundus sp.]